MIKAFFYETKIGKVAIGEDGQAITNLFFEGTAEPKEYVLEETDLIKEAAKQLNEYFEGKRKTFDLPLSPKGTDFEKDWAILEAIERLAPVVLDEIKGRPIYIVKETIGFDNDK